MEDIRQKTNMQDIRSQIDGDRRQRIENQTLMIKDTKIEDGRQKIEYLRQMIEDRRWKVEDRRQKIDGRRLKIEDRENREDRRSKIDTR